MWLCDLRLKDGKHKIKSVTNTNYKQFIICLPFTLIIHKGNIRNICKLHFGSTADNKKKKRAPLPPSTTAPMYDLMSTPT